MTDNDGDTPMSSRGIAMGTSPQMDRNIYGGHDKRQYDTAIDPRANLDDHDDDALADDDDNDMQMHLLSQNQKENRLRIEGDPSLFPVDDLSSSATHDTSQEDPFSQKKKQIQSRMNDYQMQAFDRTYTPARVDPFATPAIKAAQLKSKLHASQGMDVDMGADAGLSRRDASAEQFKEEMRKSAQNRMANASSQGGARSYRDIMAERQLEREAHEVNQMIDDIQKGKGIDLEKIKEKEMETQIKSGKLEKNWEATPVTKSRWDATPGIPSGSAATPGASSEYWHATPAPVVASNTPGLGWGATPKHARTPGGRGSRTPGLGWEATPALGAAASASGSTAAFAKTPSSGSRWDATPKVLGMATPGSRWDATPMAAAGPQSRFSGAATPRTSFQKGVETPAMPMSMANATPEMFQHLRIRQEIDARNRPWTTESVDKELDGIVGFETVPVPPSYIPKRTINARLGATPSALLSSTPMFTMHAGGLTTTGTGLSSEEIGQLMGHSISSDPSLPMVKPEDYQYFKSLVDTDDNDIDDPVEIKRRMILKAILKVKNGTPPQRKSALRLLSDKARWFGAGPLFDTILPLLMSPTLEDEERHLLVKVIDRILYKLDDLVRPYAHKILVVIEPLLIDEDYFCRYEGREIISNLAKAAGLASMIATMRPDIDNKDEYVRNTTARAFSVVASALGIPVLLPFLKAVCESRLSWEARHTGIKIVQQIAILMGCAILPHLKKLIEIIEAGLEDEQSKVRTITALALAALAEASAPYGIEAFDSVLRPLWHGIESHRGKTKAAFLKAIGYVIPLMDDEYASYYTREIMPKLIQEFDSPDEEMKKIVLQVIKQCIGSDGVKAPYIVSEILPAFFRYFWNRRMALDKRNYRVLVDTTIDIANKTGSQAVLVAIVDSLADENETYRKMVMETIDKVISNLGVSEIDIKLEERLIEGILYAFQEQTSDDSFIIIHGFGTVLNELGKRCHDYLPQISQILKYRLTSDESRVRAQAADVIAYIAPVIYECEQVKLLKHLGLVIFQLLGEEYPDVLGSMLNALKSILYVLGTVEMNPPTKDLILALTPILKNRHEKVQENCIDLVGRIADRGSEAVSPKEWMRIAYELLDMLKAHKKGIRRAAINTFGYIAKAVGPQDVIEILLNNLRVQERQNRICTTVAVAIVAESCGPFTVLPALMNEYRVPELNVQNGVLKSMSFLFEYIGETARDYIYPVTSLLEDALLDRDLVHRQIACNVIKHLSVGVTGFGCEDALIHLFNCMWPNIFEKTPHLIQAFTDAVDGMRLALGPGFILQYLLQGLFHPARRVRNVYWRLYNLLYVGKQDALVGFYPIFDEVLPIHTVHKGVQMPQIDYVRHEAFYFV